MLKPQLEERSFGSNYDPVLTGVAHGLDRLFPPVGIVRAERSGQVADRSRPNPASVAGHDPGQGASGQG